MTDRLNTVSQFSARLIRGGAMFDGLRARGLFRAECFDKNGRLKWVDEYENTVVNVGKNYMLDGSLQTAPTIVGPFMGLISSIGFSAIAATDIMTSHAGWTEAGLANAPTYTAPRKTCVWSAASLGAKALSAALTFAITGTGTVKGSFLVLSTSAVSTIDSTAGTLFSAGLFTGGDRAVLNLDTLNISYSLTL